MSDIRFARDGSVATADRPAVVAQQFDTASMGRDHAGCTRVTSGREVGQMFPEDLCTGQAEFLLDNYTYRSGMTTGGVFSPAESINARVCADCLAEAQAMPGFLRSRLAVAP